MDTCGVVVLVSADCGWSAIRRLYTDDCIRTPFGESFVATRTIGEHAERVRFVQGGWGKIAAAASTQYVIDRWQPDLLMNIGTCGGFRGQVRRGDVIVVERTIIYDMHVEIGDAQSEIGHYITHLDLGWLAAGPAPGIVIGTILTGDRDIIAEDVPQLISTYGALGADWESGAVAYVADRNHQHCIILRGVSDLVGPDGGEAYGTGNTLYEESTIDIIRTLNAQLPVWLQYKKKKKDAGG